MPDFIELSGTASGRYRKGRLLGEGGFAQCFAFYAVDQNGVYTNTAARADTVAVKVIRKSSLNTPVRQCRFLQEATLHRGIKHAHVRTSEGTVHLLRTRCALAGHACMHARTCVCVYVL